jgi:cathepsin B
LVFFVRFLFFLVYLRWAKEYPPEVITLEKMRARLIRPYRAHRGNTFVGRLVKADDEFDARTQWGDLILPVRDQAACGSCWAFAASESTGDRVGIEGLPSAVYSPQDLVSCDTNDYGCGGGYVDVSWNYILENGLALDDCIPYTSGDGSEPPCPTTCVNGSAIVRTKATSVYPIPYESMNEVYL